MIEKIAKTFLYIISVLYILNGIITLFLVAGIGSTITSILLLLSQFFLVTPTELIRNWTSDQWGSFAFAPQPQLLILGIVAIILGLLGFEALRRLGKSYKWIYVWYFLSAIAYLIALYNLFTGGYLVVLNFILAIIYTCATYVVHQVVRNKK